MHGEAPPRSRPWRAGLAFVAVALVALAASQLAQATPRALKQAGAPAPAFDCAAVLAKRTVVLFPSAQPPYVGDLESFLPPGSSLDLTEAALGWLSLSVPEHQACAQGITAIADTLIVWEDGNLTAVQAFLPRALVRPAGRLLVVGKDGREAPGLQDLTFLSRLQQVGGLGVINLDGLTTLRGLEGLQRVAGGSLLVMKNDALRNLTGLDALVRVDQDLLINSNMALRTLDGLESLVEVGRDLLLKGNGYLMSADALTALERIKGTASLVNNGNHGMTLPPGVLVGPAAAEGAAAATPSSGATSPAVADRRVLVVYGGPAPPSLDDLFSAIDPFMPPLTKFDIIRQHVRFQPAGQDLTAGLEPDGLLRGHVVLFDNGNLSSLAAPFRGVRRIGGSLLVVGASAMDLPDDAPGLASLQDLAALEDVGELGVVGTTQLRDFKGLGRLAAIRQDLVVMYNKQLQSFAGLGEDAGLGSDTLSARLASMRGLRQSEPRPVASTVPLTGGAAPPAPGLTRIVGELWVEGNHALTSLSGLEALQEVGWRLSIRSCPALQSLAALGNLVSVGENLVVLDNDNLTSTQGLTSLQRVGQSVHVMWNQRLTDIQGLARLGPVVVGDLVLAGNPITSLAPLASIKAVGLNLVLARTAATDLSGLDALAQVGGGLSVTANPRLTSLAGLGQLQRVGDDLSVRTNPALASLATLDAALRTVGGGVYVEDNPQLTSLGRLPATLQAAGGNVVVRRNAGGLPQAEVAQLGAKARQAQVIDTVVLAPFIRSLVASNGTAAFLEQPAFVASFAGV